MSKKTRLIHEYIRAVDHIGVICLQSFILFSADFWNEWKGFSNCTKSCKTKRQRKHSLTGADNLLCNKGCLGKYLYAADFDLPLLS